MGDHIDGVWIKSLRVIPDERGMLMEILRCDDDGFTRFGQVYVSTTYPGVVKAWHLHERQDDSICCVKGMVKLVMYDGREGSATRGQVEELFVGERNPILVRIPAGVHHGWKCTSAEEAIVVNVPNEPYRADQPDEHRLPWDSPEIPYSWDIVFK